MPVPFVEEPGSATVLTLGAHMCKWPIGDPASEEFTFCGRRIDADGPYCLNHARIAYQPQQPRKRSPASELARSLRRYAQGLTAFSKSRHARDGRNGRSGTVLDGVGPWVPALLFALRPG